MMTLIVIAASILAVMLFADSFRCPRYMRWVRRLTALSLIGFVAAYAPSAAQGYITDNAAEPVRVALLAVLISKAGEVISRWSFKR